MDDMGMTDNQYKDFVEGIKEDLEELNEYKEAGDNARYDKKYKTGFVQDSQVQNLFFYMHTDAEREDAA